LKAVNYIEEKVNISVSPGINVEGQTKSEEPQPALIILNPVVIPDNWKNIGNTDTREVLTRHAKEKLPPVANSGTASSEYKATDDGLDEFDDEDYDSNDGEYSDINDDDSDYEEPESSKQQSVRLRNANPMLSTFYRPGLNVLPWGIGGTFKPDIEKRISKVTGAEETIGYQLYNINFNANNSGNSSMQSWVGAYNGRLSKSKVRIDYSI
jgi:hypothetical protein